MSSRRDGARDEEAGPVTANVRRARAAIRRRLAAIASEIGALDRMPADARRECMARVSGDIEACLRPHLAWEERTIHPIVDKYACDGPAAFSSSMRYEHEIIHRWTAELRDLAQGEAAAFVRRADNLLGVVLAHFELEEHVLFPVLDRIVNPAALLGQLREPPGP